MYRTRHCGEFEASQIGDEVHASGWTARLRDHGGLVFIDLRDRSGVVQLVIDPEHAPKAIEVAQSIRVESVIHVRGKVVARTEGTVNPNLPTGAIEILVDELDELAPSDPLPFQLDDENVRELGDTLVAPGADVERPDSDTSADGCVSRRTPNVDADPDSDTDSPDSGCTMKPATSTSSTEPIAIVD
jgi:aspartyl/asparaginyl-tRNA synthetase